MHAPSGRSEIASVPFPVLGFGVTDVDGDDVGDVVSLGGTSFTTVDGNAAGTLSIARR